MFQLSASRFEVGMDIIHFCFFLINEFIELMSNFGRIVHYSVTKITILYNPLLHIQSPTSL